jgi:cytochrome P450
MAEPATHQTVDYDPTAPEVLADPLPIYEELRERCPVHRFDGLEHTLYTLSRRDDIHAMLSDTDLWSNRYGPGISYSEQNPGSLQRYDPPEHTLRRRFLREPFLPKAVERFEPAVSALATSLIDGLEPRGHAELHDDYASPLPITAFTHLLGLPLDDRPKFKHWAEKLTLGMTFPDEATEHWDALRAYTLAKVRERRSTMAAAEPDLGPDDDPVGTVVPEGLLSHLACHRLDDGEYATDDEVTGLVAMMLVAGHETTTSLITNATWRLLEDRRRWERLLAEPDLVPNVIEESLRFDPPVLGDCRTNNVAVTIHGVDIPADSKVMHLLRSANHDPEHCEAPDEFWMDRPVLENRKHYAFGWGTHFCLGAHLARMTARTALATLISRLPTLRLDGPTERLEAPFLWGRRVLPVAWD